MQIKYSVFIENHVIQNFVGLMIRVKNTEAEADMGSREAVQNKFQRWNNNRLPFPKRKRDKCCGSKPQETRGSSTNPFGEE